MDPTNTQSRAYRCTPIFTGYISQGLWPLERRTNNASLRAVLTGAADWYLARQEDARGSNPGSFPNSYWYGANGSESAPVPVSGNYATTQHAASASSKPTSPPAAAIISTARTRHGRMCSTIRPRKAASRSKTPPKTPSGRMSLSNRCPVSLRSPNATASPS